MQRFLILLFLTLMATSTMAQQDPQFSHNMFNHLATNPGHAGIEDAITATGLFRQQWAGFDGAPKTNVGSIEAPLKFINSGVGINFISDRLGVNEKSNINLAFAYHFNVGSGKLGVGLNFGLLLLSTDGKWLFPESTEVIPEKVNEKTFDFGLGVFYKSDRFYAGVSSAHLSEPSFKLSSLKTTQTKRHYYITSGYRFALPIQSLEVEPSIFIKSDGSSFQYSANANFIYNKKIWAGVSYRAGDSVIALIGLELMNGLKLGYAYDITTSDINRYSNGTNELMIKYSFEISVPKYTHKYKSARFL